MTDPAPINVSCHGAHARNASLCLLGLLHQRMEHFMSSANIPQNCLAPSTEILLACLIGCDALQSLPEDIEIP